MVTATRARAAMPRSGACMKLLRRKGLAKFSPTLLDFTAEWALQYRSISLLGEIFRFAVANLFPLAGLATIRPMRGYTGSVHIPYTVGNLTGNLRQRSLQD